MSSVMTELRRRIILTAANAGEGHIPSALSILDILWVLYDRILRFDPASPAAEARDRFVLSKGHGGLGLYAVLAAKGFFPAAELDGFAGFSSRFGGHPDTNKVPGVEASTGSLGHGFPMAVGMAMGLRIKGAAWRVYCLIGDGECNEGAVWEAALLAAHHELSNLCCIVDFNHSTDRALALGDLTGKFEAFGWDARTIDGHDQAELARQLATLDKRRPTALIAKTVKGKGCPKMENNPEWHHRCPKPDEVDSLLRSLE